MIVISSLFENLDACDPQQRKYVRPTIRIKLTESAIKQKHNEMK